MTAVIVNLLQEALFKAVLGYMEKLCQLFTLDWWNWPENIRAENTTVY